jgi:streptogrisin C
MKNNKSVTRLSVPMLLPCLIAGFGCSAEVGDETEAGKVAQSQTEAWEQDVRLVSEARGWTFVEAALHREATEAVGRVAERIARERPEIFVGSMVSDDPSGQPTLFVKGPADAFVQGAVGNESVAITVADNQPYSFSELEQRLQRAFAAIEARGLTASGTFRIERQGAIDLFVGDKQDAKLPEILEALPADVRPAVNLKLVPQQGFVPTTVFGGMRARLNGVNQCTTGWAVRRDFGGEEGVTTSAHCTINQVVNPVQGTRNVSLNVAHWGQWGDIELDFEAGSLGQPDDFYSDAATIRDVTAVEPVGGITLNESICVYGRSSNSRDCSRRVDAVSYTCTYGGVTSQRQVHMNGAGVVIGGDSGGGWSFGNTAYGSQSAICSGGGVGTGAVFSVADYFDEALGARVQVTD